MMGGGGMGGFGGSGFGLMEFIGPLIMLVFWGLIIALIVLGIKWLTTQGTTINTTPAPEKETILDVLKKAYASGKIDTKEYEERKKTLGL